MKFLITIAILVASLSTSALAGQTQSQPGAGLCSKDKLKSGLHTDLSIETQARSVGSANGNTKK